MKGQATMKKKLKATKIDGAAQPSVDDTLREWYGHDGWDVPAERKFIKTLSRAELKKEFCDGIDRYLSRSVAATMRHYKDHNASKPELCVSDTGEGAEIVESELEMGSQVFSTETGIRLARDFMCGDFDTESLRAVGVDTLYNLMLRFYRLWQSERELNVFYSAQYHPQVLAALDAQKFRGLPVQVCGEGMDIYHAIRKLEERETQAMREYIVACFHDRNASKAKAAKDTMDDLAAKIKDQKKRLSDMVEEVYETLKRAESKAGKMGADALRQFKATKDAALTLGAPDMKQAQRKQAAWRLIEEREAGNNAYSVIDAANYVDVENNKGGYSTTSALITALHKQAAALGIAQFIDRSGKRGRPHKR